MKKLVLIVCLALSLVLCGVAAAENQYFFVETPVEITDNSVYSALIQAGTDGWVWSISENTDITSWIVKEDGTPAFADESGIARAHLVYGPLEGEETDVATGLQVTIDMSRVTGLNSNGSYDLYFAPLGKDAIWAAGKNHGQYVKCSEKLGHIAIPAVTADGVITGTAKELENTSATVSLDMEDLDLSLVDLSGACFIVLEGDGYYPHRFTAEAELEIREDGILNVNVGTLTGPFGMQGGDGNGHYNMRLGVTGLRYNGLPLTQAIIRTDIYAYGRTFLSDHGSLIWFAEPAWSSEAETPVLCDVYPDEFTATWPIGMDASGVKTEDVTITMISAYGDEFTLTPGTDYTVNAGETKTLITTKYIYWAYAPVYTTLRIQISTENVVRNEQMYADTAAFSHSYDIVSVYAYSEMSQYNGSQAWTYFGFKNLTDASQVFKPATYSLMYTDENGRVFYYGEKEDGTAILVDTEADGIAFNCDEECNVHVENNMVLYTRVSGTQTMQVDGREIEFTKRYVKCEVLPRAISELDGTLELLPGYTLGATWEDHLKWPWQSFINIGYMSNNK